MVPQPRLYARETILVITGNTTITHVVAPIIAPIREVKPWVAWNQPPRSPRRGR